MAFYTYLLASKSNGTLYAGHTDDLRARVQAHNENPSWEDLYPDLNNMIGLD